MVVLKHEKALGIGIVIALSLALSACGSGAKKAQTTAGTTTKAQTTKTYRATDPASVERCLATAGLSVVVNGNLPIIQRSKAVGVRLSGGGNIMPGSLSAAVFWYASPAKAKSMMESVKAQFKVTALWDEIVVVYDPMPSAGTQAKINACVRGY
jgi:hypothetical protein